MKRTARGSYPHPVVDTSDDVDSVFEVLNVTAAPEVDDIEVKFRFRLDDPDLRSRLDSGRAQLVAAWRCGATLAAGRMPLDVVAHHSDGQTVGGTLDQEWVRDKVIVDVRIVNVTPDPAYRLSRQNPEYGEATFEISSGDVLAEGGSFEFSAEKLFDPLNPPVGSCFRFDQVKGRGKGIRVSFNDDDVVVVQFTEKQFQPFSALGARPDIQIALVVLPALMETIEFIKRNEAPGGEDLSDRAWYVGLKSQLEEAGSMEDSTLTLAQKMLGHPLDGVFTRGLVEEDEE